MGTWSKTYHVSNAKGVQHVVFVQVVNILTRNDIDFGIPVALERIESQKLLLLLLAELWKVALDEL